MIGSYGNRCANIAISDADLLFALGTRLDIRQTGIIEGFIPNAKIIHVDIDINELIYNRLNNRIHIQSDVFSFINKLNTINTDFSIDADWFEHTQDLKNRYSQDYEIGELTENKAPYRFIQQLTKISNDNDVFCADIGQNQMWSAQTLKIRQQQIYMTSGGLAPMGYSIPASIGLSFAMPDRIIYSINGDGGFHIAVQSLMLISQYNLPIKVIVMNNNSLGMITQFQKLYFEGRMNATTETGGYLVPDIKDLASAYNLKYYLLTEDNLNDSMLNEIISARNCVIEYAIDGLTTVSPKLEYNNPIWKMSPIINI
jgi:acetolactate synthase-1/2/3 large subunit